MPDSIDNCPNKANKDQEEGLFKVLGRALRGFPNTRILQPHECPLVVFF